MRATETENSGWVPRLRITGQRRSISIAKQARVETRARTRIIIRGSESLRLDCCSTHKEYEWRVAVETRCETLLQTFSHGDRVRRRQASSLLDAKRIALPKHVDNESLSWKHDLHLFITLAPA